MILALSLSWSLLCRRLNTIPACLHATIQDLEALLYENVPPDTKDSNGNSLLLVAAQQVGSRYCLMNTYCSGMPSATAPTVFSRSTASHLRPDSSANGGGEEAPTYVSFCWLCRSDFLDCWVLPSSSLVLQRRDQTFFGSSDGSIQSCSLPTKTNRSYVLRRAEPFT